MRLTGIGTGLVGGAMVIGLTATACGKDKAAGPSSSSASTSPSSSAAAPPSSGPPSNGGAAQSNPYGDLLIKPTDIAIAGDTFAPLGPPDPVPGVPGAQNTYLNSDASRTVKDSIYIYQDAAQAGQALAVYTSVLTDPYLGVKDRTPIPVDVGNGGKMITGAGTDGASPKAKGEIAFTEGRAFVSFVVMLPPNESVTTDLLLDLARKQDAAVKARVPS
jgi:hypothetical protein